MVDLASRARVERLLRNDIRCDDLTRLLLALRSNSGNHKAIRELGDFVSHSRQRGQGITTDELREFFTLITFPTMRVVTGRSNADKLPGNFGKLLSTSFRRLDAEYLEKATGLTQKAAYKVIGSAIAALRQNPDGTMKLTNAGNAEVLNVVNACINCIVTNPIFDADCLFTEFCGALEKARLITKAELRDFSHVRAPLALFAVSAMHNCRIDLGGGNHAILSAMADKESGTIKVMGAVRVLVYPGKPLTYLTPIFTTDLDFQSYCEPELVDNLISEWQFEIELKATGKLGRLVVGTGTSLAELKPTERRLVEFAAFLEPSHIPLSWLRELVGRDMPEFFASDPSSHADAWDELLRRLLQLDLLVEAQTDAGEPRIFRIDRLVQEAVLSDMSSEDRKARDAALVELVERRDRSLEQIVRFFEVRGEVELLDILASYWDRGKHARAAWLLNQVGVRWLQLQEWNRAELRMRRALAIDESSCNANDPAVACCLSNIAVLLAATDRMAEAEPPMRRALAMDENGYGPEHSKIVPDLINLGKLLQATGRMAEAEPLIRRAVTIAEKPGDSEEPQLSLALNALAGLLLATNSLAEAEPLIQRAFDIAEKEYGTKHVNFACALSNLCMLYELTDRPLEAELSLGRALEISERIYGPEHYEVASVLMKLGAVLGRTRGLPQAERLLRRALSIYEKVFGPEHQYTAVCLNNLAKILVRANRMAEGEFLMRRCLLILQKLGQAAGLKHPHLDATKSYHDRVLENMELTGEQIRAKPGE